MATYTVSHVLPTSGFFSGTFALATANGPESLHVGAVVATRIEQTPTSAVYSFAALRELLAPANLRAPLLPPVAPVDVIPRSQGFTNYVFAYEVGELTWDDASVPAAPAIHPAVQVGLVTGTLEPASLSYDGQGLSLARVDTHLAGAHTRETFRAVLPRTGFSVVVDAWRDTEAVVPWARWGFVARRTDGQEDAIPVMVSWRGDERATLALPIVFGSLPVRRAIVLPLSPPAALAVTAISPNLCHGIQKAAPAEFLGLPTAVATPEFQDALRVMRFAEVVDLLDGRDDPNPGSADGSHGYTAAHFLWSSAAGMPETIAALVKAAEGSGTRPRHWYHSGRRFGVWPDQFPGQSLHKGQPYNRADANTFGVGERFAGANSLNRRPHDEEHESGAVLATAVAVTADWGLRAIAESYLSTLLLTRSVVLNYPQVGRGQGRPWVATETLGRLNRTAEAPAAVLAADAAITAMFVAHRATRIAQYNAAKILVTGTEYVPGLYYRGSNWTATGVYVKTGAAVVEIEANPADPGSLEALQAALYPRAVVNLRGERRVASVSWDGETATVTFAADLPAEVAASGECTVTAAYSVGYETGSVAVALRLAGGPVIELAETLLAYGATGTVAYRARFRAARANSTDYAAAGNALQTWIGGAFRVLVAFAQANEDPVLEGRARFALQSLREKFRGLSGNELFAAMAQGMPGSLLAAAEDDVFAAAPVPVEPGGD